MIRRPPRSTLFPSRRSSDLMPEEDAAGQVVAGPVVRDGDRDAQSPALAPPDEPDRARVLKDRKSTRLNSSHSQISYAVFCLKKKKNKKKNNKKKKKKKKRKR